MDLIRVLIVDDHPVMRKGIRDMIETAPDIEIIGETGSGQDALRMAQEMCPDVVLLDMELEDLSGVQVARILRKEDSCVRVLALSAYNDQVYVQELLNSGASGYLSKDEMPALILTAVRGVASGEKGWISRGIIAKIQTWKNEESTSHPIVSLRESQVLDEVAQGKTNHEIGLVLCISEKTVEKHLNAIFSKLSVGSRTQAAVWAAREAARKPQR